MHIIALMDLHLGLVSYSGPFAAFTCINVVPRVVNKMSTSCNCDKLKLPCLEWLGDIKVECYACDQGLWGLTLSWITMLDG